MKRALAAVAMAAAALSITTLAVANGTSPATYKPRAPQEFRTFAPFGIGGGSLDPTKDVAAADPTSTPTSTPTGTPVPSPTPTLGISLDRQAVPSLPAAGGGSTTTRVVTSTPRPTPRPLPPAPAPVAPAPVAGATVAAAQAYAISQIGSVQYGCLYQLWMRESGWNTFATNRSSGAYGIPQALPGYKMATAGADWATNPVTQVKWGLGYVAHYGGACGAWAFWQTHHWY